MIFSLSKDYFFPNIRRIGFSNYLKNYLHFERTSPEFIFYYVVSGNLYIMEDGVKYHLKEGDYLFLEPYKHHVGYKAAKCKYYHFHLNQNAHIQMKNENHELEQSIIKTRNKSIKSNPFLPLEHPCDYDIIFPKHATISNKSVALSISSLLQNGVDVFYNKYEHYKLYASSRVLEILILIAQEYTSSLNNNIETPENVTKTSITLNQLIQFINRNYQKKINIELIEESMGLNYDYLNELLKKQYKTTIGKYVQYVRIEEAKKLIRETDLNFSEIAYLVGINDPYYFSKVFKNVVGITPTKYANQSKYENIEKSIAMKD